MKLTCEWSENRPLPSTEKISAEVKRLYDGRHAVSIITIAKELGINVGAAHNVLDAAAEQGMVRAVLGQGWVPLKP